MKIALRINVRGNALVVTVSVVATILALLGSAVSYTQHISRLSDRSRKTSVALEVADGHLEYLFTSWRNIYRDPKMQYRMLPTQYFFTAGYNPGPAPAASPSPVPPIIAKPSPSDFPSVPNYTLSQYRIQAVNPMLEQGQNENSTLSVTTAPSAAYGPNAWQYSFFYLASVDVAVPSMTGSVTAKVRRVFEKKFDNPWTFAMFYVDDLEFSPSSALTITGPIQTNGNLYISTSNFTAQSKVGYGGEYVNGYSPNDSSTKSGSVTVPNFPADLPPMQESPWLPFGWNLRLDNADGSLNNDSYHELIERPVSGTDAIADYRFYNQAGIKVLIDSSNNVTIYNASGVECKSNSGGNDKKIYDTITSALTKNIALQDAREGTYVRVANLDISKITTAINNGTITGFNGVLYVADTTTNGSSVSSKLGGNGSSVATTERGIRLINGYALPSGNSSANNKSGLTVVSENPVYIQGNYNTSATGSATVPSNNGTYTDPDASGYTRKNAAVIADAITVLSGNWSDTNSPADLASRIAANTTINTALVSGNVPSASGTYSGGGENFIRLLEDWKNNSFTYYGSMVQLYQSIQATGQLTAVCQIFKSTQVRKWYYDTNFSNASPPGNLQIASYLQQQRWYQVY